MGESAARDLATYWKAAGLSPRSGASEDEVHAFEQRHRVKLPRELRDYFATVDGLGELWPGDQEPNGFSFWPLSRVAAVAEEARTGRFDIASFEGSERLFIIADYLDRSWVYAVELTDAERPTAAVLLVGRERPELVASSFAEFVHAYTDDAPELYGEATSILECENLAS